MKLMTRLFKYAVSGILLSALPTAALAADARVGDAQRGKALYRQCKRCHQIGGGAGHRIGPHLNDLFGRPAGTLPGFSYSPAMRAAGAGGLVWTGAMLDTFLARPRDLVPRSRMSFAGIAAAGDRTDLLAWLHRFSGNRPGLPAAEPTSTPGDNDLDPQLLSIRGDSEYGAYLAGECTACHRADGADEGTPSIVGWPVHDFVIAMHLFKHGKRTHPAMQLVAGRLSDEEIAALAVHFRQTTSEIEEKNP